MGPLFRVTSLPGSKFSISDLRGRGPNSKQNVTFVYPGRMGRELRVTRRTYTLREADDRTSPVPTGSSKTQIRNLKVPRTTKGSLRPGPGSEPDTLRSRS